MQIPMPVITRILETALYVDDLDAVVDFYRDILGLRVLDAGPRLVSLDAGQATVLLLFRRGATISGLDTLSGWIPPHDGQGPVHLAFAIATEALGRMGAPSPRTRCRDREPSTVGSRRTEYLLPRPRRSFRRAGHTGNVGGLLAAF